jgi:ribosomal protein L7/L12
MEPYELARVARLEAQVAFLLNHLEIDPDQAALGTTGGSSVFGAPSDIFGGAAGSAPAASRYPPGVLEAIQKGRMIEAIKIYRSVTGVSLKEAKDACEAIARG